ncbi:hypothetical protein RND81_14G024000 [Saponaria officinalis]|uniref:Peptidase A1 domain-containing protein n=1 Tax=Saponaria officinalis TaxID=3572 RepID=A0AAW1GKJ3_SAPOF
MPLVFPNSPESPLYIKNLTRQQRLQQLVYNTINRAHIVSQRTISRRNFTKLEWTSQEEMRVREVGEILVKLGVGTFQTPTSYTPYYLSMDTGSDQIWLQCEGCKTFPNRCFGMPYPKFYPNSRSSTYHQIPCGTHELCYTYVCKNGQCSHVCRDGYCSYHIGYSDNSEALGILAFERFVFGITSARSSVAFNLLFGCNTYYQGTSFNTGEIGILGIGWGPRSFITQIKNYVDDTFSYCFPHYDNTALGAQGYLKIGVDDESYDGYNSISLFEFGNDGHYYLKMHGISVGGHRLSLDPSIFSRRSSGGGTVIDSGATITSLVPAAYKQLKKHIVLYLIKSTGSFRRTAPGENEYPLDLCYKRLRQRVDLDELPAIVFHFEGADLFLRPKNVYVLTDNPRNGFCLAMLPRRENRTSIGAYQQSNFKFVFDRRRRMLHFKEQNCNDGF